MSHEMSYVTSQITCHKHHKKLQNSLGPHVWPEFLVCHIFLETWGKLHYIGNDSRYHYSLLPSRLSDLGSSRTSSMYKSVLCIIDPMCYICILGNHQSPAISSDGTNFPYFRSRSIQTYHVAGRLVRGFTHSSHGGGG